MTSTAPAITDVTTDKAAYTRGEPIMVTVGYLPGSVDVDVQLSITARGQGAASGLPVRMPVTMTVDLDASATDPAMIAVDSTPVIAWTLVSDDGSEAVFRGVWQ